MYIFLQKKEFLMNGTHYASQTHHHGAHSAWQLLKYTYGILPIAAGLDKFFDILVNWSIYAHPSITSALGLAPVQFMYIVGIIEIVAGIIVLSRWTKFGGFLVAAWLILIAINLASFGMYYDIAVRDVALAMGAIALALLSPDIKLSK
jgi:hypothetical protein